MSAIKVYLTEFYDNPDKIEEYKINFLKNNFYHEINKIMIISRDNLKIGVTSNRNLIYFVSKIDDSYEVVYDHVKDIYYKKYKYDKYLYKIDSLKDKKKEDDENTEDSINDYNKCRCIIA